MDICGIWKVKEVRVPTPDGEKVFTPDNPPEDERFEGSAELMQYRTEFAEDGIQSRFPENDLAYAYERGLLRQASFRKLPNGLRCISERKNK